MELSTTTSEPMRFDEFVNSSTEQARSFFGESKPTIEQIEELHWSELMKSEKKYSIDNELSLFGTDCKVWNLDRFTIKESNIHGITTHHTQRVSRNFIMKFFYYDF